eukprot:scaffold7879_cov143-Cylindrotheca_fusiformis.AAC.2
MLHIHNRRTLGFFEAERFASVDTGFGTSQAHGRVFVGSKLGKRSAALANLSYTRALFCSEDNCDIWDEETERRTLLFVNSPRKGSFRTPANSSGCCHS